jgi:DNA-directed RNA polymerase subunit beta'
MKTTDLERIIDFQDFVVVDPGGTPLKERQLLTEEAFRKAKDQYKSGEDFRADMGAEAVRQLLMRLDLAALSEQLRREMVETSSTQKIKHLTERLELVEALRDSGNRPEWMVLGCIPVIPPNLRPLVLMDSGNFAASDLNDLYKQVINRNKYLRKLADLNAPEVIIRNEKRRLQRAVDALFDNSRCQRPMLGSSNRPMKSLTDMIRGKQGRLRENLLSKRVNYSARSVIVVGPDLKLHQCGLPKKNALELFRPFIIRRLKELAHFNPITSAKKMLERCGEEVRDILVEVMRNHPVLLSRAPTLQRMRIQAFEPVLVEGNAIRIHPLVCKGFNVDFDGDQMAVHLPLSIEAQAEAMTLMMSTSNIFSPANGNPIISPTRDIVMGAYYLTVSRPGQSGDGMVFATPNEVFLPHSQGKVGHARIKLRLPAHKRLRGEGEEEFTPGMIVRTTVGRVVFNDILHSKMPFYNLTLGRKQLQSIIADCYQILGRRETIALMDRMKDLGFRESTRSGLSFATDDLKTPPSKDAIIAEAEEEVSKQDKLYRRGIITDQERYNKVLDAWTHARERITAEMMEALRNDHRDGEEYLNPIFLMAESGARGGVEQIRRLAGMRGLMAEPSGKIIETPIKANFREGLSVLEYFRSTRGARKSLADAAFKTADSVYLTKKLADVAQNVVITMEDCGTSQGITKGIIDECEKVGVSLVRSIRGRVSRVNIIDPISEEVVVKENEMISPAAAEKLDEMRIETIQVRSPMTCEASPGVCRYCYGMDLATGTLVEVGMAVGIIAAQSIGGLPRVIELFEARRPEQPAFIAETDGRVEILDEDRRGRRTIIVRNGSAIEREYLVPRGKPIRVRSGDRVRAGDPLVEGPLVPHDVLRILGEEAVQRYLVGAIQDVCHSHGVEIDDKHLEIIIARMLRTVRVQDVGDTVLLPGSVIDKSEFHRVNRELMNRVKIKDPGDTEFRVGDLVPLDHLDREDLRVEASGRRKAEWIRPRPAARSTQLLGITKAAARCDSFLSAASFQETTKVLTEAAMAGKVDTLVGLKENAILGHLVPAGTGFKSYLEAEVRTRPEAVFRPVR